MKVLNLASNFATYIHYPFIKMEEDFQIKHFTYFFQSGLAYIFSKHYRSLWSAERHTVTINKNKYKIVKVYKIPRNILLNLYHHVMYLYIIKKVKKENYDIIHSNCIDPVGFVAYKLSKKLNIPYVITEHGSYNFFYNTTDVEKQKIINRFAKIVYSAEVVITVSDKFSALLKSYWSEANIKTVNNSYNRGIFKSNPSQKGRHTTNEINVITVGRFDLFKNHILLLKAINILHKDYPNIRLSIIGGDGSLLDEYIKYIEDNKLNEYITIKNYMPPHLLVNEYYNSDIFVLPSLIESFGIVCLEALACGVPVIASNTEGPSTIINHDVDGLLFENNNVDDLVSKMKALFDNPDKRVKMSHNALIKAKLFKNKHHELYAIFQDTINKHKNKV